SVEPEVDVLVVRVGATGRAQQAEVVLVGRDPRVLVDEVARPLLEIAAVGELERRLADGIQQGDQVAHASFFSAFTVKMIANCSVRRTVSAESELRVFSCS